MLLNPSASAAVGDTGVDTAALGSPQDSGDAQTGTTSNQTGTSVTVTGGGTVTEPTTSTAVDTSGWSGGYSAADLAGEKGGNSWEGGCSDNSKSAVVLVGLLALARRRG
jgi:hypothetical protein